MQIADHLEQIFGVAFKQKATLAELRQFHSNNAFCCDDEGKVLGICACENDFDQLTIPSQDLECLEYLNLGDNKNLEILELRGLFPKLRHLDVSDCRLKRFKLVESLQQLRWLDISRNQLSEFIPIAGAYADLVHIDLSGNQLPDFEASWLKKFPKLERLYLKGNPLPESKKSSVEERANAWWFLKDYLLELEKGTVQNKEYKVLVVGNGGVGKSCLVERMVFDSFEEGHLSTEGVVLARYAKEDFPFILNLWDFGGQDIYHATHRMFMQSGAIYLLLWDEETRKNPTSVLPEKGKKVAYPNYSLDDYWLPYIQQIGKNSPVIVVKTKAETDISAHPKKAAILQQFESKFPSLDFHRIDSKVDNWTKNGFNYLLFLIKEAIAKIGRSEEIPETWFNLRKDLRELQAMHTKSITIEEYLEIAQEYLDEQQSMKVLQNWLVPSGVVFYRQGFFQGDVILDQGWAMEAVYTLFNRSKELSYHELTDVHQGEFSGAMLSRIWGQYSQAEQSLFISYMLSCELCFETTDREEHHYPSFQERTFVAPQLLPDQPNEVLIRYFRKSPDLLYVRYRHTFLHYGILQSFIIRTQKLAKIDGIWRQGIILEEEGASALIQIVEKEIRVEVERNGISLLNKIRSLLSELQKDIEVEEEVSLDGKTFVASADLQASGKPEQASIENKEEYAVFLKTTGQETFDELPTDSSSTRKKRVFISYAHKDDSRYIDCFLDGIKTYGSDDWEIFWDKDILLGEDWRQRLQHEVKDCDFAIFLLSQHFFKSDFIKEHEFEQFILRNEKEGIPVFFVELSLYNDFAKWEEVTKRQIFKPQGQDYGLGNAHFGEAITFDMIAPINTHSGRIEPSPYRNKYFNDFVLAVNEALSKS